jgi:hypothetical protein
MAKLKLPALADDRQIEMTVELPTAVHRDLVAYADVFAQEHGQTVEPDKLIPLMLEQFMATDQYFTRVRGARKKNGRRKGQTQADQRQADPTSVMSE